MKKKVASVGVAALLAGTGFGVVLGTPMLASAQDAATTTQPGKWVSDTLKGLVDKGTINQEQSDAVAKALDDARPQGDGRHGPDGRFGGPSLAKAAEVLGVSEADLRTALGDTKSLADVAKEKNVDLQKVIDALVAEQNSRIDTAVKDGKLTQAEGDARKAKTVERVTADVNRVHDKGGPGGRHGGRGPGGDGPDGRDDAPAPQAAPAG